MKEYAPNVRAVTVLGGWRGAVGWACIVVLGILPFMGVAVTTWLWLLIVTLIATLFGTLQIVEAAAALQFNELQQVKATKMEQFISLVKQGIAEGEGTKED